MRGHLQQRGADSWRLKVFLGRSPDGKTRYLERTTRGTRREAEQELGPSGRRGRQRTLGAHRTDDHGRAARPVAEARGDDGRAVDGRQLPVDRSPVRGAGVRRPDRGEHPHHGARRVLRRAASRPGAVPLRRAPAPRTCRVDRPGVGNPPEAPRQGHRAFLTHDEAQALLAAPDPGRWEGRRDRALLALALQTGLRLAELTNLNCGNLTLDAGAHVSCLGKGRKQRVVPLTANTVAVLRTWTRERAGLADDPMFCIRTGRRLSPDAIQRRVSLHVATAGDRCPSLAGKNVTPHVLRHTAAMALLQAGVVSVSALWLGHEDIRSTQTYLHADLAIKERALARTTATSTKPGRFRPTDPLFAFLEAL